MKQNLNIWEPRPFSDESVLKHLSPIGQAVENATAGDLLLAMIALNREREAYLALPLEHWEIGQLNGGN